MLAEVVRMGQPVTLSFFLLAVACGGVSKHHDGAGAAPRTDAGDACAEPQSEVPDVPPYAGAPLDGLLTFAVTFHNRCAQTVWPAWAASGGLENGVIDGELWLPLASGSDRSVTVHGGVRELDFWGRTGCSFDALGNGACLTGDCGRFICSTTTLQTPPSTTVYSLESGFLTGYNLGLRVEGPTCGVHACVADLHSCATGMEDACGATIACSDVCSISTCCAESHCTDGDFRDGGDLVFTFCP
jgi:hypothetical protein